MSKADTEGDEALARALAAQFAQEADAPGSFGAGRSQARILSAAGRSRATRDKTKLVTPAPAAALARPYAAPLIEEGLADIIDYLAHCTRDMCTSEPPAGRNGGARRKTFVFWRPLAQARDVLLSLERAALCAVNISDNSVIAKFTCQRALLLALDKAETFLTRFDSNPFPRQLTQPRTTLVCTPTFSLTVAFREKCHTEWLPLTFVETGCVCGRRVKGCACSFLSGAALANESQNTDEGKSKVRAMGEDFVVEGELGSKRKRQRTSWFGSSSSIASPPSTVTLASAPLVSDADACHQAGKACAKGRVVFCTATGHWWCKAHWRTRVVKNSGRAHRQTLDTSLTITLNFWNPFILHRAHGLETEEGGREEKKEEVVADDAPEHGDLCSLGVCVCCERALSGPARWDAFEQRWLCFKHFSEHCNE